MATITDTTTDANDNIIINVSSSADDAITLATAGTYSDKNIIFNITMGADFGDAEASDVVAGKTFTSAAGIKVTGTHECSSGGSSGRTLVSKSGTTQKASFDTGLSEIVAIVLKRSVNSTGLANASFVPLLATGTVTGCSSYGTYMKNYVTGMNGSNYCNVEGGTFHWTNTNSSFRFVDPEKYDWYAIGYE